MMMQRSGPRPGMSAHRCGHGRPDRGFSPPDGFATKTRGSDEGRAAGERARFRVAGRAWVVGIGLTRIGDGYGVKVDLATPPAPDAGLPESVDGVPVRIEVVGGIRPS